MTDPQAIFKKFNDRRADNLAFFEKSFKPIYDYFKDYKLKESKLNILTETEEVDLWRDGRSVYNGQAKKQAADEVRDFKAAYSHGDTLTSFIPPFAGDYRNPRFMARAVDKAIRKSPLTRESYRGYKMPDFYPCVVFMGCGLGYQIEMLLEDTYVNSVYILEPDLDNFAASLYAVDWRKICEGRETQFGASVHFLVGKPNDPENEDYVLWGVLWNALIKNCPAFPIMTLFFNHQRNDRYDQISDKINDDLLVFMMSWGNYDDELNQLNQAIHNLMGGMRVIPPPNGKNLDVPIVIVGSGPSLDARMDSIKQVRDRIFLISCGSSLRPLYANGIKPDIHVELECDYLMTDYLKQLNDPEYIKSLRIVGPSHLNPVLFRAFGQRRCYFKKESGISSLFGRPEDTVVDGTPTCTNLALALACHYRFHNIYLFGMDFGFHQIEKHHSKDSAYYEEGVLDAILDDVLSIKKGDTFYTEGVNGEKLLTTPAFFTAKRKAEHLVRHIGDAGVTVHNCSDGSRIDRAQWMSDADFLQSVSAFAPGKADKFLAYLFGNNCRTITQAEMDRAIDLMVHTMDEFVNDMKKLLDPPITTMREMTQRCFRLNWYLEDIVQPRVLEFYFLSRGAVRHFLYVGFSHSLGLRDEDEQKAYMDVWRLEFIQFLDEIGVHFRRIVTKKFDINTDPWVTKSIMHDEDA